MKICIIDVLGLPYNGNTLKNRGLGGSESSVIRIARELVKLGIEVLILNMSEPSQSDKSKTYIYDGVQYDDLRSADKHVCDIMISSRSVEPFRPENNLFGNLQKSSRHKVLWMHDTFIQKGDNDLEPMVMNGSISEIFTLSDFHTTYITNCAHGTRRNFEVLKNKIFQTRNGVELHKPFIDIREKDKNLWVFNASYTKGMEPTVKEIWPLIRNDESKLVVIGGYYRFPNGEADEQEKAWNELRDNNKDPTITFTGIIKQEKISDILAKASFFLAPGQFPETFGISALEATCHNVPVIASRFGALEETCVPGGSYMVNYTLKNNALFRVDEQDQLDRFVHMCKYARENEYVWQQKAYGCNIVKDIVGWDGIALQWKQHFYRLFDKTMTVEENKQVKWLNYRVHKVFNRHFSNHEDFL